MNIRNNNINFLDLIPLSAYIHLPWCIRKCPYCDFNSHTAKNSMDEDLYIKAILKDIELGAKTHDGRKIKTIFIGGGTPSLFHAQSINLILEKLRDCFGFSNNIEVTMEANPGTIEHDSFTAYNEAGVSRLSIGIQSFDPQQLITLGRIHDENQAHEAIEQAMSCPFNSVNIDIMHGLPTQSIAQAENDLRQAIKHQPPHISWYQLTIEKNTFFDHQPPTLPTDDCIAEIQSLGQTLLLKHQYTQYEISAFSKPGHECQHNMNYWQFGDYLGFGAGAHGKMSSHHSTSIQRSSRCKHPQQYMAEAGTSEAFKRHVISEPTELIFEFLMNHLRLSIPVKKVLFLERTLLNWQQLESASIAAVSLGLVNIDHNKLNLTQHGQKFLNDTLMTYLPTKNT